MTTDALAPQVTRPTEVIQLIWRTCRHGYLDHAFMLHCVWYFHPGVRIWGGENIASHWQQMHFLATLLMLVIEIRFNFQIYVQCSEKAISKITFNIQWNLKQHWHPWHTWLSKGNIKGFQEQWGLSGLISVIRLGLAAWPGVGGKFFTWLSSLA